MADRERKRYRRDETARNPNLDPDPELTPDPDLGPDGLQPGHTPPDSNSATASPPDKGPTGPPRSRLALTVAIIVGSLLLGLFFVGYIAASWADPLPE